MTNRLVSVGDDFTLPAALKVADANLPARLGDGALNAAFATVLASNGATDQTTRINAALAAGNGFGVRKTVKLVGDFNVTQIVVPSSTTLDCRDATITQISGTGINILVNTAALANKRTIYAAMTSGSAVLTATATNESIAAAPFAAGDVGKRVIVQGAGVAGAPLDTTIIAITSASAVTLAATASTTVSGQYAAVGARDKDITVLGGVWSKNSNGPDGSYLAHQLRFRHLDGLRVDGVAFDSIGGKYGVSVGDCTRFSVQNIGGPKQGSDVVHINGPASFGSITNINVASIHDDLVSLTAGDSTGGANKVRDTAGDITDIEVDTGLYQVSTYTSSCLKIVAGKTMDNSANYWIRRVRARNFTGPDTNGAVVYIGDSSGGSYDDIDVDGVRSLGGSSKGCVIIQGGNSIDRLRLANLKPDPADSYAVSVGASVKRLEVSGLKLTATTGAPNGVTVYSGTVDNLILDRVQVSSPSGAALRIQSGATVTMAVLSKLNIDSGYKLIDAPTGAALGHVSIVNLTSVNSPYPLAILSTVTTMSVSGLAATGVTALAWVQGAGALTLVGMSGIDTNNDTMLGTVNVAAASSLNSLNKDPDRFTSGEEIVMRLLAQGAPQPGTGQLILTYFTARRNETINNVNTITLGTAATGTTLARVGIYSVATSGDLTLVASTANDTTMWGTAYSGNTKALSAPWSKVAGQRYAFGTLFVGTTGPKFAGVLAVNGASLGKAPRLAGSVASQADLPSTITNATISNAQGTVIYGEVLP